MTLVTHQTWTGWESGATVLLVRGRAWNIARELYAGIVLDRAKSEIHVWMAPAEGGMEIEKVAAETPEKILKEKIDPRNRIAGVSSALVSRSGWDWKAK